MGQRLELTFRTISLITVDKMLTVERATRSTPLNSWYLGCLRATTLMRRNDRIITDLPRGMSSIYY